MNNNKYIKKKEAIGPPIHILAINKNTAVLDQLANTIDSDAVCLMATASRRQGLQILKDNPYIHAVLLDIHLLIGQSQTFTQSVQQVTHSFNCPKIVCTGEHKNFDHVRAAMHFGAIDFLCVPSNQYDLMACINRALYANQSDKVNFRYLQKIDQNFKQLQALLLNIKNHPFYHQEPSNSSRQPHSEVHDSEHPNPYMQKAITLTRLQEHKDKFEELPDLMSQAWTILMEIFKTEMSGRSAYVTTVAVGSSVPVSSTHRHLDTLENKNLVRRLRDAADKRRIQVQLTDKARAQLVNFFDKI